MGDESIWKKEISFGRKKKAEQPVAPAPVEAAPPGAAPAPEQVPFWKKEISLGGKKKEPAAPADAIAPESTSVWKKEISLGRKKQKQVERLAEAAVQAVAPLPSEQLPVAPTPIEPEILPEPPAPVVVPEPVAAVAPEPAPEPVYQAPAAPEIEIVYQAPPAPEPTGLEPLPEPPPLVAAAPAPAVEQPTAVVPPRPEPVPAAAEPWQEAPVLPPAPEPPVVVHPPVPAAELPPVVPEPKVPFWKKEIGGKKKAKPVASVEPAEAKVPFWKKEIGGKKKQPAAATTVVAATTEPAEKQVPFWKKEIGGKKKSQTAAAAAPRTAKSAPFWKRELAVKKPSISMTRGSKSLGKKGGAKAKRLVGLKIGGSQIAAARVTNNGHAELLQVARQPLDQGVVVMGELRDPDALAEQLKAFFARHKLPKKNVRLGIASNRIGVRIFDVAGIDDEKALNNAIQFRAQEALPIPLDEAVLDYHVLSESVNEEGQPTRRILLVVAYRELVERYIAACRKAGITLLGIDLEAFAVLRALAAPREDDAASAALVAVAVGYDRSTFAVSDGRICEFTRVLEWGGSALNVGLARALDLAPSEVESIKRSLTLDGTGAAPDGLTQEQWAASLDAVRKQVQNFARELVSSLQFYQNQPGSLGIGEIVLTGGTAHLPGLADELQRLIGVRVRVGDPLARLKVAKKVGSPEQVGSLAVAIGLGIED